MSRPRHEIGIADVMRLTGLSRRAVEGRVRRGTIPAERGGGRLRFDLQTIYDLGLAGTTVPVTVSEMLDRIETLARRVGELEAELSRR